MVEKDTGLIGLNIPIVLDYLPSNYGKITSQEVKKKENEVLDTSSNPANPITMIYRPIEQLQKTVTEAKFCTPRHNYSILASHLFEA